jgi:hypothetical protein
MAARKITALCAAVVTLTLTTDAVAAEDSPPIWLICQSDATATAPAQFFGYYIFDPKRMTFKEYDVIAQTVTDMHASIGDDAIDWVKTEDGVIGPQQMHTEQHYTLDRRSLAAVERRELRLTALREGGASWFNKRNVLWFVQKDREITHQGPAAMNVENLRLAATVIRDLQTTMDGERAFRAYALQHISTDYTGTPRETLCPRRARLLTGVPPSARPSRLSMTRRRSCFQTLTRRCAGKAFVRRQEPREPTPGTERACCESAGSLALFCIEAPRMEVGLRT